MDSIKAFYDKYLRRWVKAIASAIGGAVAGLLINFIHGDQAIPQNREEWVTLLVATVGPALLALISPANKITQKQLDKDPNVVNGVALDGAPQPPRTDIDDVPPPTPGLGGSKSSWK